MIRPSATLLALSLVLAGGGTAAARPGHACPQLTDARGDVVYERSQFQDPDVDVAPFEGWNKESLDVLSASVGADATQVTATVRVAGLPTPLLDAWKIPRSARIWDIEAWSTALTGVATGDDVYGSTITEGGAYDETSPARQLGRFNDHGCS